MQKEVIRTQLGDFKILATLGDGASCKVKLG